MDKKSKSATEENIHLHYGKIIKWLIVGWVATVVLMSAVFMWAWCQYDYTSEESVVTYSQDGEGVNNINNGTQGDLNNGADIQENDTKKNTP